jgi:hypothetical protein
MVIFFPSPTLSALASKPLIRFIQERHGIQSSTIKIDDATNSYENCMFKRFLKDCFFNYIKIIIFLLIEYVFYINRKISLIKLLNLVGN